MATSLLASIKVHFRQMPLARKLFFLTALVFGAYWIYSYQRFQDYDFLAHTHIRDIHSFDCDLRRIRLNSRFELRDTQRWSAVYDCPLDMPLDSVFHPAYVTHPDVDYSCRQREDGTQRCNDYAVLPDERHAKVGVTAERPDSMTVVIMCYGCLLEPER
jgi:hypothetical protein